MSGGSPDTTIKDTPEQKALAKVAAEEWNYAQEVLAPLQDLYMEQVDDFNSEDRKDYVTGKANLGAQNAIGQGSSELVTNATANGLDLGSGKFKSALSDSVTDTAAIGGEVASRGLMDIEKGKAQGLQNVAAIGAGQETQAVAGLSDISSLSAQTARSDAYNAFNRNSANLQTLGTIAGAGANYYMNSTPSVTTATQMRSTDGGGAMVNNGNDWDNF